MDERQKAEIWGEKLAAEAKREKKFGAQRESEASKQDGESATRDSPPGSNKDLSGSAASKEQDDLNRD